MILLLVALGVLAGALTTVAGLGGGVLLLLAMGRLSSPASALAATAPALLLGNLHRFWILRDAIDRRVALQFARGALPGAFVGGLLAIAVSDLVLRGLLVAVVAVAVLRALGWWQPRFPATALTPAGAGIGALTATTGGAGLLASPVLLSAGLTGEAFVATGALAAAAMHLGRLGAYGLGGLFDRDVCESALVLAPAVLTGNVVGRRLRKHLSPRSCSRVELATLAACALLALAGLGP